MSAEPILRLELSEDGATHLDLDHRLDDETVAVMLEDVAAAVRAGQHRTGLPSTP